MSKLFRKLFLGAAAFMLAGTFVVGCGGKKQETQSSQTASQGNPLADELKKEAKLTMWLIADQPKDTGLVVEELGKLTKRDLNATLDVKFMSTAEWSKKYPLLLSSGEPFDLIFEAKWTNFNSEAQKGGFLDLSQLLPKYAPKTYASLSKEILETVTIDSKLYAVPSNYFNVMGNSHGYVVRGDLRKKYNLPEIKSIDDFEKYLDAVAKNEKGLIPLNLGSGEDGNLSGTNYWKSGFVQAGSNLHGLYYNLNDKDFKLYTLDEIPGSLEFYQRTKKWVDNGYLPKNAFANTTSSRDSLTSGKSASAIANFYTANEAYIKAKASNPDWNLEFYPMYDKYIDKPTSAAGLAVNRNSKYPERALMLIEKLRMDKEYQLLTLYGIQGKHYEVSKDGKYQDIPGLKDNPFPPEKMGPFGWRNQDLMLTYENALPNYSKLKDDFVKAQKFIPYMNFQLNTNNIKNELAALKDVNDQYLKPLVLGSSPNPEQGFKTLNEKLKAAGIDKVKQEILKQYEEYLKTRK